MIPWELVGVVSLPIMVLLGSVTHEVIHYVTAVIGGRRATISFLPPVVHWELPRPYTASDRLIAVAPQVVGICLLLVNVAVNDVVRLPCYAVLPLLVFLAKVVVGSSSDLRGSLGQFDRESRR